VNFDVSLDRIWYRAHVLSTSPERAMRKRKRGGNDQPTWSRLTLEFRGANATPTDGSIQLARRGKEMPKE
jgi:hypothetical protein